MFSMTIRKMILISGLRTTTTLILRMAERRGYMAQGTRSNRTGTRKTRPQTGKTARSAGTGRSSGSASYRSGSKASAGSRRPAATNRQREIPSRSYRAGENRERRDDENTIRRDLIIITLFAAMIFLFLGNFGILGPVGDAVAGVMFGLFGLTAYILPILVFVGCLFYYANRDDARMPVKLGAAAVLLVVIGMFCEFAAGRLGNAGSYDLAELYLSCSEHRNGGGVLAGSLAFLFHALFRTFGTILILIIIAAICIVLMTQRSLIEFVGDTAENARKRHEERMRELEEEARYMEDAEADTDAAYMETDREERRSAAGGREQNGYDGGEYRGSGFSHRRWMDRLRERQTQRTMAGDTGRPVSEAARDGGRHEQIYRGVPKNTVVSGSQGFPQEPSQQTAESSSSSADPIPPVREQSRTQEPEGSVYAGSMHQNVRSREDVPVRHDTGEEDTAAAEPLSRNGSEPQRQDLSQPAAELSAPEAGADSAAPEQAGRKDPAAVEEPEEPEGARGLHELSADAYLRTDTLSTAASETASIPVWKNPVEQEETGQPEPAPVSGGGQNETADNRIDYSDVPMLHFVDDEAVPFAEETDSVAHGPVMPPAADTEALQGSGMTAAATVMAMQTPGSADLQREERAADADPIRMPAGDRSAADADAEKGEEGKEQGKEEKQSKEENEDLVRDPQPAADQTIPVHKEGVTDIADRIVAAPADAAGTGSPAGERRVSAPVQKKPYVFPPMDLLKKGKAPDNADSANELRETAMKLQNTLHTFGVNVKITDISQGPAVTRYEMQPEQGVKVSRIVSLQDDIKLALAATDIRIEAPIPGKSAVGIEVPNRTTNMVALRDILDSPEFRNAKSRTAFGVGKDIAGKTVVADIAKMPHLLIAGATGSGKSVCINTIIMSILYHATPDEVKLIMIDPKVVELSVYNGIPHLLLPVVTDSQKAAKTLNWCVAEMEERFHRFADAGVRDIRGYNAMVEEQQKAGTADPSMHRMPHIVIIVDELADLMMVAKNEVETAICRLAQLARAAGMHLIIATQRPSVDVITGLIKANMPSRIAFAVTQGVDSRTILDMNGAEKLLGKGDMLFFPQGLPKPQRIQGAFVSDEEVTAVVNFLKRHDPPEEDAAAMQQKLEQIANSEGGASQNEGQDSSHHGPEIDELFTEAGRFIIEKNSASIGLLQRRFRIGFNRAARIMDQLAEQGIVSQAEGTKPRKILMTEAEFEAWCEENI